MSSNINEYEIGYLKRLESQRMEREDPEARKARLAMEEVEREELLKTLSVWDYVILESIRRKDPRMRIRIGTMKTIDGMEKVFRCGLVKKPDRMPPFDERERLEAFKDSLEYKQYEERLKRMVTWEERERIKQVLKTVGLKEIVDMLELTESGRRALKEKRAEMLRLWRNLTALHAKNDKAGFQEAADGSLDYFPLMVVMGFASSSAMTHMISEAGTDHLHWVGESGVSSWCDDSGYEGFTDVWF